MRDSLALITVSIALLAASCGVQNSPSQATVETRPSVLESASNPAYFSDVTDSSGIDFLHQNGATGKKYLPEIMGAGGCVLDYDGDGLQDVYLVQSGSLEQSLPDARNRLYRNLGNGRFEDVTARAGVGDAGYGMGAAAADYDNDGDTDIYLLNLGPDVLFRNNGDGSFSDVTKAAGIDSPLWGSSAAWLDADRDGDLDLYVVNYLDFTIEKHVDCGRPSRGLLSYCSPDVYESAPDVYFRNRGDGTFEEYSRAAGIVDPTGKGLGVVAADLTGDGWTDIYVANDSTPNFLFENQGDGTFQETGIYWGVSHNESGLTEAGMGVDAGDVNGDGYLDLFVTNLSNETNALYLGGETEFLYHTRTGGLFDGTLTPVGFGTDLLDLDNDGDLDIVLTNGHVIDNIELLDDSQSFRQPSQIFLNDGTGHFQEVPQDVLGPLATPRVGRATLTLDYDNDGRLDLLITYNNDRARLYKNRAPPANWIGFNLSSQTAPPDALGARVTVETGAKKMIEEKKAGSSYQTSSDPRIHFGLGSARSISRVLVTWPNGERQEAADLEAGFYYRWTQGATPSPIRR